MSESDIKEMETRLRSKDALLRRFPGSKLMRSSGKIALQTLEKDPFALAILCGGTTLCGDCITCIVHSIMTSWRKKLPRIGLATCLGKDYSGSFNVLNHRISEPCKSHIWIEESPYEILEPVGASRRPLIDSMDWLQDNSHAGTLLRAVVAKLYIRPIEYLIRENGKSYTYYPEVSLTEQSLILKGCQRKRKIKHELCSNVSLSHTEKYPTKQRGKTQLTAFYCDVTTFYVERNVRKKLQDEIKSF